MYIYTPISLTAEYDYWLGVFVIVSLFL